ncbi:MAG TPA: cupin domain-containing protein [Sediminispirochaeta sp.]|nr:cupin domain-containing protein [Sediminispirochaeta sp.]
MIRRRNQMRSEVKTRMREGEGEVTITHLVEPEDIKNGRLIANVELPVGASIGPHPHHEETEYYLILEGHGEVEEQDGVKEVQAGDVVITGDGQTHSLKNLGDSPLKMIALIIQD